MKLLWAMILILLVMGCKTEESEYNVFKYNLINHPNSLDPAFAKSLSSMWITHQLFNTLVKVDEHSKIIPSLAKSWKISEDGLSYTFYLRSDVYFHPSTMFGKDSTRTMTAADVKFSLDRIMDADINSPGSWIFENRIDSTLGFEAVDDTTFVLHLRKAFRPMVSILTMPYCAIVPQEINHVEKEIWRSHPIGTGPYVFKKWIKNQNLFLTKNNNYWGPTGNLDGIKVYFITDHKIAFLELLNGNLDLVSGLESSFINEMLTPNGELQEKHRSQINYLKSAYLNTEYIGINPSILSADHPLRNKDFRKALNYAIDKKLMLSSLRNGVGFAANAGFTPRGLPSFNAQKVPGYSFDLAKAKKHLEESKIDPSNMEPLKIKTNQAYADLMLFVCKQWEQLGIKSELEILESSLLREGMRNNTIDLFRASWIGDYLDAENFMSVFEGSNGAPPNYTRFKNATFDELYRRANLENEEEKRNSIFMQMDQLLIEEAPIIFLFYDQSSNFYRSNISGMYHSLNNLPDFQLLTKEK